MTVRLLLLASALLFVPGSAAPQGDSVHTANPHYQRRMALFETYATRHAEVVMLGNSITAEVDWNELMDRASIVNRGIRSDVTAGFLARLDQVIALQPRLCCIMGGINDLYNDTPVDTVVARYRRIIGRLRAAGITPVIQSTLLVSPRWKRWEEKNPEVRELNRKLAALAAGFGVEFLDLNAVLADGDRLADEVTTDGVHLNATGYARWRDLLDGVLSRHGL